MCETKKYNLYLDSIKKDFNFLDDDSFKNSNKGLGLTHRQGNKYKLLPYTTKKNNLAVDFKGVTGAFSRLISNRKFEKAFDMDIFIAEVVDQIAEFEGEISKETFKDIIRTMFIKNIELVDFDIKTINYISSTSTDDKIAKFLYSVLFDNSLKDEVLKNYNRDVDNILYKLVLRALPELKEQDISNNEYKCYLPFIKELFIKDFKFIIRNEELYKNSLKRFLEYYYVFYVSQLSMKLDKFEQADLSKADKIYYTLSWESTSKNRIAYRLGWELLKGKVNSLFAHAITLELLNHHGLEEQLGYVELANIYNSMNEDEISKQINSVFYEYISHVRDTPWEKLKFISRETSINGFNEVYKLFDAIEFQFLKSKNRKELYKSYKGWFEKFIYHKFAKKRGPLGYNLNMTEDDIILMTKICIKDSHRMKLNTLFDEFELRGLFFDRDSKMKIIHFYEKLNLLEKKSDSGDAQYVRSVL